MLLLVSTCQTFPPFFLFCSKRRKGTLQLQRVDKWKPEWWTCGALESGSNSRFSEITWWRLYLLIWLSSVCLYTQLTLSSPTDLLSDQDQDIIQRLDSSATMSQRCSNGLRSGEQVVTSVTVLQELVTRRHGPERTQIYGLAVGLVSTLGSVSIRPRSPTTCWTMSQAAEHCPFAPLLHQRPAEDI